MGGTGGRRSNGKAQKNYAKANERTVKTGAKPNDGQAWKSNARTAEKWGGTGGAV